MNKAARKAVNLSALKRHDSSIIDIVDSSSYVVVYKFDNDTQAWTKKGVEGTMFVFKRSVYPAHGVFVMNRLGIENMMTDLTADMDLQLTSDYIIYRTDEDIHGIWVFEPADRERIGDRLVECCKHDHDLPSDPLVSKSSKSTQQASRQQPQPQAQAQAQAQARQQPAKAQAPAPASESSSSTGAPDLLTRMLEEAMSKARVAEQTGSEIPSTSARPISSSQQQLEHQQSIDSAIILQSKPESMRSMAASPSSSGAGRPASTSATSPSSGQTPSFLLAILGKDDEAAMGQNGSQQQQQAQAHAYDQIQPPTQRDPLSQGLLGALQQNMHRQPDSGSSGNGTPVSFHQLQQQQQQHQIQQMQQQQQRMRQESENSFMGGAGNNGNLNAPGSSSSPMFMHMNVAPGMSPRMPLLSTNNGPPLSAELLPASVMPNGLYGVRGGPLNGRQGSVSSSSLPGSQSQQQEQQQQQQQQMMSHSPMMMPGVPFGPPMGMMPPPPPMPYHHHPLHPGQHLNFGPPRPGMMGMPVGPPPGTSFQGDSMHAAIGSIGYVQQQQQQQKNGKEGDETDGDQEGGSGENGAPGPTNLMPKEEFSRQFLNLVQTDPQFMEVLYSNYLAMFGRRRP